MNTEPVVATDDTEAKLSRGGKVHHAYKHGCFCKFGRELNERDIAIIQRLADGHRLKNIAYSLEMCDKYLQRVLRQLQKFKNAKTTSQLVAIALREGLIK